MPNVWHCGNPLLRDIPGEFAKWNQCSSSYHSTFLTSLCLRLYSLRVAGTAWIKGTVAWNCFWWLTLTHLVEKGRNLQFFLVEQILTYSNPTGRERKNLQFFSCWTYSKINWDVLSFPSFFAVMHILHIHREQKFFERWPQNLLTVHTKYTKWSPNTQKAFKDIRRIRRKNLCEHGEYAKRLLELSPYTPTKRHKTEHISVNNGPTWKFLGLYFLYKMGWIKPKNHFTLLSL